MKIILLFVVLLFPFLTMAQDGFYFTREQHDKIRKNLDDYKTLLVQYDFKSEEFEKLKREFEFLKQLRSKEVIEYTELKREMIDIRNTNIKLSNALAENEKLKKQILLMESDLKHKEKTLFMWKGKYNRQLTLTRGDRIMAGVIEGIFISCGLIAIFTTIESRYLNP